MSVDPKTTTYVIEDLLAWQEQGVLVLSPKFQRRSVWKPAARSYFIDTILRGFPVPPLHIRMVRDPNRGVVREVVDGQQRLRAVFDFVAGKQRLSRQLDGPWAGSTYESLSGELRSILRDYSFHVYQYSGVTDQTILEIFARINTYSVALNAQELRNGRYFGHFKRTTYSLALEYLQFWRSSRVFTESAIARMQEAQLVSELLILQMDGVQDKKQSINDFYAHLDEDWGHTPERWLSRNVERPSEWLAEDEAIDRFKVTMSVIVDLLGDMLPQSEFTRVPLFYTLYSAIYHRLYGIPRNALPTPARRLSKSLGMQLREAVEELSDLVSENPKADTLRGWKRDFIVASARQTDNLAPRQKRLEVLWTRAEFSP